MELSASHNPHKSVESGVARSPQLSSEGLSSPPRSSPEVASPSVLTPAEVLNTPTSSTSSSITTGTAGTLALGAASEKPPSRRKPRRKLNDPITGSKDAEPPKVKRIRKPKNPNAPPAPRRKKNVTPAKTSSPCTELKATATMSMQPSFSEPILPSHAVPIHSLQIGKSEEPQMPVQSFFNSAPPPGSLTQTQPRSHTQNTRTSGQNYDPIRSSNYDPIRETVVNHTTQNKPQSLPSNPSTNNLLSASPSISNLVDSKSQSLPTMSPAVQSFFNQHPPKLPLCGGPPLPASQICNNIDASSTLSTHEKRKPSAPAAMSKKSDGVMSSSSLSRKLDTAVNSSSLSKKPDAAVSSSSLSKKPEEVVSSSSLSKKPDAAMTSSSMSKKNNNANILSTSASPKPTKPKEPKEPKDTKETKESKENNETINVIPPPLPGSGNETGNGTEYRAPTVILSIPIFGEVNKYVNFTRLAEQRYGWDALHPRLAAQRDRLARIAAAGAALERNGSSKDSGDEMSLDSEGEGSNVEMGGMSDGRTGADCAKKVPKKRKMREDEYDKDDGFVDDTELLWEEQAAASNDGFFVYSGPLIPEGDKASLDGKADGASKRGRGRGSRGGGSARSTAARGTAASASTTARNNLPASGPGSRGGSTTRKPRVTKAERARMEQEKLEREKSGLSSTPSSTKNTTALPSASSRVSLPMVLNE